MERLLLKEFGDQHLELLAVSSQDVMRLAGALVEDSAHLHFEQLTGGW